MIHQPLFYDKEKATMKTHRHSEIRETIQDWTPGRRATTTGNRLFVPLGIQRFDAIVL